MVNAWEQTPPFLDKFGGGEGRKLLPVLYPIPPRPCFHRAPASNTVLEIILAFCMAMHRKNASTRDGAGTPAQVRGSGDLLQGRLFNNARKAGMT